MNLSEEQYYLIEAYLNNELSDADRQLFDDDLQADDELRAEVNRQRDLRLGLRALGIEAALNKARTQYNATLERSTEPTVKPLPTSRPLTDWRYWAAAAGVVLVLGVSYFTFQRSIDNPTDLAYADTSVPGQADVLLKEFPSETIPPANRQQWLDALRQYKASDYDKAIAGLKTLPTDRQSVHYKNYLLGLSYLANKQPTAAIPLLRQALRSPSRPLRQKAEWFLALAYVKNKQPEKARPTLKRISADRAHPFQSLAQQVLQKIN